MRIILLLIKLIAPFCLTFVILRFLSIDLSRIGHAHIGINLFLYVTILNMFSIYLTSIKNSILFRHYYRLNSTLSSVFAINLFSTGLGMMGFSMLTDISRLEIFSKLYCVRYVSITSAVVLDRIVNVTSYAFVLLLFISNQISSFSFIVVVIPLSIFYLCFLEFLVGMRLWSIPTKSVMVRKGSCIALGVFSVGSSLVQVFIQYTMVHSAKLQSVKALSGIQSAILAFASNLPISIGGIGIRELMLSRVFKECSNVCLSTITAFGAQINIFVSVVLGLAGLGFGITLYFIYKSRY